MKYNRQRLPRDGGELDEFARERGLRPVQKSEYRGSDIYIAETDLEMDRPVEYPWGYYQVMFCVSGMASKGKPDIALWGEYPAMHDKEKGWTPETKQKARIADMVEKAKLFIDENIRVGRYG